VIDTSKTGVHINGEKVQSHQETKIKEGDIIGFGKMLVKFEYVYMYGFFTILEYIVKIAT